MSTMTINGQLAPLPDDPDALLIEVVRDTLDLTGTKLVCGAGVCGACTVLLDGEPVRACLVLAARVRGRSVLTVEGLEQAGAPDRLQDAFARAGAVQCGFCTPGMLLAAHALLDANPLPTEHDVREALAGNLCRCTGYTKIIEAVLTAAAGR